jgi:predicted acetyltransferase
VDLDKEWRFCRAMPEDENGLVSQWAGISREDFVTSALPKMLERARGENLPEGQVPDTVYFLWDEGEIVGQFRLRHYLNESLRRGAGHIGYYIAPPYRGKNAATEGLRLLLELAAKVVPEKEFYLRLRKGNLASLRVMEKNGGVVAEEDPMYLYVRIPKPKIPVD